MTRDRFFKVFRRARENYLTLHSTDLEVRRVDEDSAFDVETPVPSARGVPCEIRLAASINKYDLIIFRFHSKYIVTVSIYIVYT